MVARPHPGEVLEVLRADLAVFDVALAEILNAIIQEQLDALGDAVGLVLAVFYHAENVRDQGCQSPAANDGDDDLGHGVMRLC